ncbi:MAG: hypothetical protein Q9179_006082 [Wetmoreana sp. 5 TL-2023]
MASTNAIVDVLGEARDNLSEHITTRELLQQLEFIKKNKEDAIAQLQDELRLTNLAIEHERLSNINYRQNLRRFFEIALPKIEQAARHTGGPLDLPNYNVHIMDSYAALRDEVDHLKVEEIGNKKRVFSDLERHWRKLGSRAARPYEPLFHFVTGRYPRTE